jgi:ribose transport system permease protein
MTDEAIPATVPNDVGRGEAPPEHGDEGWIGQLRHSTAFWIGLAIVAIAIVFGLTTPEHAFTKPSNLLAIGLNASVVMLLGVGMTFLIGAGHLDLSVGYSLILASVLGAKTMVALGGTPLEVQTGAYPNLGIALLAGVSVSIGSGVAIGLLNGLLVTRLRLSSFIVTLATSGIAYGIALILTSAANVPYIPDQLQAEFGGAKLFVLMGVLVGIAAIVDISRNGNTNVSGHQTDNLQAIAAVVIGGTSLFGGIASIGGTLLGTLIPVMLGNGLVQMAVNPFYQFVLVGIILILAVYFDQRRRERAS